MSHQKYPSLTAKVEHEAHLWKRQHPRSPTRQFSPTRSTSPRHYPTSTDHVPRLSPSVEADAIKWQKLRSLRHTSVPTIGSTGYGSPSQYSPHSATFSPSFGSQYERAGSPGSSGRHSLGATGASPAAQYPFSPSRVSTFGPACSPPRLRPGGPSIIAPDLSLADYPPSPPRSPRHTSPNSLDLPPPLETHAYRLPPPFHLVSHPAPAEALVRAARNSSPPRAPTTEEYVPSQLAEAIHSTEQMVTQIAQDQRTTWRQFEHFVTATASFSPSRIPDSGSPPRFSPSQQFSPRRPVSPTRVVILSHEIPGGMMGFDSQPPSPPPQPGVGRMGSPTRARPQAPDYLCSSQPQLNPYSTGALSSMPPPISPPHSQPSSKAPSSNGDLS
eukprot:NODE_2269_length_1461_cov_88.931241_g2155_i0.p1 GENE.NODE_2269_length_1461_cov_88.931241_g2155_i0~~NODE_2269_length_1461_cov_88.931241_g2155_i0.p1  ORF type:complete len:385 (+),score=33.51 NODE_2269_length_1461_cov_88.931241_g2155_i0:74-1228(+)